MRHSFSPILLAGILSQPLPKKLLNRLIEVASDKLSINHPDVIERLNTIVGTCFVINPTDLPYSIKITVKDDDIEASLHDDNGTTPDVCISGALTVLIDLLSSKADGDALFFSRGISVEGDTEALLTLRNALDSEDIDFWHELLDIVGPLRYPADLIAKGLGKFSQRITSDMEIIANAITAPVGLRTNALQSDIEDLRTHVIALKGSVTKQQKNIERLAKRKAV